jgi:hypothetical protein
LGDQIGVGRRLVALPRVGSGARVAWVYAQRDPDVGSGGCPLGPGVPGLELAGITHPSFNCPWPPWWCEGVVMVVIDAIIILFLCKKDPGE